MYLSTMAYNGDPNLTAPFSDDDFMTPCDYEHVKRFGSIFMPFMYYVVFFTGLIGNILVIAVYILFQKLKDLTDIYLVNLAIADILFLFTLPFWAQTAAKEWSFGTIMCKVVRSLYSVNLYSCMLTLTCITLDRFFAIVLATKCHGMHTKNMLFGKILCLIIWLSALVLGTPEFMFSDVINSTKKTCEMQFSEEDYISAKTAKTIQLLTGFIIPLLSMLVCYTVIVKTLISAKGFQKHKSIKIIFAIVISFVALQLPYNIITIILACKTDEDIYYEDCHTKLSHKYAIIITEAFAYMHCCLNPILYAFLGQKFKKTFKKLMKHYGLISQKQLPEHKMDTETSKTFSAIYSGDVTSMYQL